MILDKLIGERKVHDHISTNFHSVTDKYFDNKCTNDTASGSQTSHLQVEAEVCQQQYIRPAP